MGRHAWTIPPDVAAVGFKVCSPRQYRTRRLLTALCLQVGFFSNLAYIFGLVSTKISILVLYLQVLRDPTARRLCQGWLLVVVVLGIWSFVSNICQCVPVAAIWDPFDYPDAWCFPLWKVWTDIAIHLTTEVGILLIPMPFLIPLKMQRRKKIGVMVIFALGTL